MSDKLKAPKKSAIEIASEKYPAKKHEPVQLGMGIGASQDVAKALRDFSLRMHRAMDSMDSESPMVRAIAMSAALEAAEKLTDEIWQYKSHGFGRPFSLLREVIRLQMDGDKTDEFPVLRKPQAETNRTKSFKLHCAVAVSGFMRNGATRLDASNKVAKLLASLDKSKKWKPETIADWRDSLIGNSNNPQKFYFDILVGAFEKFEATDEYVAYHFSRFANLAGVHLKTQPNRFQDARMSKARAKD